MEFHGGNADANNTPSTLFEMYALEERVNVCQIPALLNAILWVFFALAAIAFLRWFFGTVMRGSPE